MKNTSKLLLLFCCGFVFVLMQVTFTNVGFYTNINTNFILPLSFFLFLSLGGGLSVVRPFLKVPLDVILLLLAILTCFTIYSVTFEDRLTSFILLCLPFLFVGWILGKFYSSYPLKNLVIFLGSGGFLAYLVDENLYELTRWKILFFVPIALCLAGVFGERRKMRWGFALIFIGLVIFAFRTPLDVKPFL